MIALIITLLVLAALVSPMIWPLEPRVNKRSEIREGRRRPF
jgi:hypothetical protein